MSNARKLAANLPIEGSLSGRNILINGAVNVNQRGSATLTNSTGSIYGPDRWRYSSSQVDNFAGSFASVADAPAGSGFTNSVKLTTTTAESAVAADEYVYIGQIIEAQNLQHLAYGTSSANKLTLSFWVKSTITGTFSVGMYKPDNTAHVHNRTYTISNASTWEYKTINYEANTLSGGAITNDTGNGLYLSWHLLAGSTYKGGGSTSGWSGYVSSKWADGLATDAVITTANATFQITGCQLEVGPQSTPFENEPFGVSLRKCQRYFARMYYGSTAANAGFPNSYGTYMPTPAIMRVTPTASVNTTFTQYPGGSSITPTISVTGGPGSTNGEQTFIRPLQTSNNGSNYIEGAINVEAELI